MIDPPLASLDLARLDAISDGDKEVIAEVLALYVETANETLAALTDAASRGDRSALASAAHRLRGSSSAAGAPVMSSLAASLESGAPSFAAESVVATAAALVVELRAELVRVCAAIARLEGS